jgi:hypothetical protein
LGLGTIWVAAAHIATGFRFRLEDSTLNRISTAQFFYVALVVISASPGSSKADIPGFSNLNDFAFNQSDTSSTPSYSNGELQITNLGSIGANEARSVFYKTLQSDSSFTANFTYRATNAESVADGIAFVIQKSDAGLSALGTYSPGLGYQNIGKSIAITLQTSSGTGLFNSGTLGAANSTQPVNLTSGHKINVSLSYNGSILSENLLDVTTAQSYSASYPVNIPFYVGSSMAYVGFTGSTGNNAFAGGVNQYLSNFTFHTPNGDYNKNGVVSAADYVAWRNSYGQHGASLAADGDGDGTVGDSDYQIWRQTFGQSTAASAAGVQTPNTQLVAPEPGTVAALVVAVIAQTALCRTRLVTRN